MEKVVDSARVYSCDAAATVGRFSVQVRGTSGLNLYRLAENDNPVSSSHYYEVTPFNQVSYYIHDPGIETQSWSSGSHQRTDPNDFLALPRCIYLWRQLDRFLGVPFRMVVLLAPLVVPFVWPFALPFAWPLANALFEPSVSTSGGQ
jgi:hypothetical protein